MRCHSPAASGHRHLTATRSTMTPRSRSSGVPSTARRIPGRGRSLSRDRAAAAAAASAATSGGIASAYGVEPGSDRDGPEHADRRARPSTSAGAAAAGRPPSFIHKRERARRRRRSDQADVRGRRATSGTSSRRVCSLAWKRTTFRSSLMPDVERRAPGRRRQRRRSSGVSGARHEPVDAEVELLAAGRPSGSALRADSYSGIWKRSLPIGFDTPARDSRSVPPPPMNSTRAYSRARPVEERREQRLVRRGGWRAASTLRA